MKTFLFTGAALALALAATPASAQLLGGGAGGGLGGSLGGLGGAGNGSLGGMIERGPLSSDSITSSRTTSRADRSVDTRKGRVKASDSTSTDSSLASTSRIGKRAINANGAASGNANGDIDAQLVGTDAVRGAMGQGMDNAGSVARRTRATAGALTDRARSTAGNAGVRTRTAAGDVVSRANNVQGAAAGASGTLSGANGSASGSGNLALAGSGATGLGAFPVNPGMVVTDAKGRTIGTVQSARSTAQGKIQSVLVKVGHKTAELPAANFSGSGNVLVSAMGKGDVKDAAQ